MRFSIATLVWTGSFSNQDLDLVRKVADLGYDDLEIAYDGFSEIDAGLVRERLQEAGIGAVVLAFCLPERDVSSSDSAVREAGIDYLTQAVDFADAIGARVVGGPVAHPPARARALSEADRRTERGNAATSLRQVADHCGQRGIRLGIEQLSRYDSDMFNTAVDTLEFVSEVDHESAGIVLDTFHIQMEERSAGEAIRTVADDLAHFHAVESHRGELGTGQIDWDDVFESLTAIGYGGAVSIESFAWTGESNPQVNMWRPWFEDSDAFAEASLRFARSRLKEAT